MSDETKKPVRVKQAPGQETRLALQKERRAARELAREAQKQRLQASDVEPAKKPEQSVVSQDSMARAVMSPDSPTQNTAVAPRPWPRTVLPLQMLAESRRARRRKFFIRLGLFCGLPTLLTYLYLVLIASPRYITETEITYQAYGPQQSLATGLEQTFLGASMGSTVDLSSIVYEYIRSDSLARKLDDQLHIKDYYSSSKADYFSRMPANANLSTFLRYYHWYVNVSEGAGGYLTIDVEAFDKDFSLAVSKAIVTAVDQMIDDMTLRARQDEVRYAEEEVARSENRMRGARLALTTFQNAHGDINPQGSASQLSGIVGQIEGELATQRAALASVRSLGPASPQITAITSKITALEEQLKLQRQRLTSSTGGSSYAELLDKYSALQTDQELAQSAYTAAQQGLSIARADAARKQNYLIDFAPPHTPDKAGVEFTLQYTVSVLALTLVLFGIGSLIGGAMRDQSGL